MPAENLPLTVKEQKNGALDNAPDKIADKKIILRKTALQESFPLKIASQKTAQRNTALSGKPQLKYFPEKIVSIEDCLLKYKTHRKLCLREFSPHPAKKIAPTGAFGLKNQPYGKLCLREYPFAQENR